MEERQRKSLIRKGGLGRSLIDLETFPKLKSGKAVGAPSKVKIGDKKEIRVLMCKECQCKIDVTGCSYDCKYDALIQSRRDPKTLEVWVYNYTLDRIEKYKR